MTCPTCGHRGDGHVEELVFERFRELVASSFFEELTGYVNRLFPQVGILELELELESTRQELAKTRDENAELRETNRLLNEQLAQHRVAAALAAGSGSGEAPKKRRGRGRSGPLRLVETGSSVPEEGVEPPTCDPETDPSIGTGGKVGDARRRDDAPAVRRMAA
jgi:hypothetical protein